MKRGVYLTLAFVILLCVAGWTGYGQGHNSARPAWEYKTVWAAQQGFRDPESLNELGAQGWELVSTAWNESSGVIYTFKRQK
jgi:hypothetical protein